MESSTNCLLDYKDIEEELLKLMQKWFVKADANVLIKDLKTVIGIKKQKIMF